MANTKIINTRIQSKVDTHATWLAKDPVLLENEEVIATSEEWSHPKHRRKIGDGVKKYSQLPFMDEGNITTTIVVTDDGVIDWTPDANDGGSGETTYGTNAVNFNATVKHAELLAGGVAHECGNTTLSVIPGEAKTIKLPQLNVEKHGHVTKCEDEEIRIKIPGADATTIVYNSDDNEMSINTGYLEDFVNNKLEGVVPGIVASGGIKYLGTVNNINSLSTTATKGSFYRVIVEFTQNNVTAHVGDLVIAEVDSPTRNIYESSTDAAADAGWVVIHAHVDTDTNTLYDLKTASVTDGAKLQLTASDRGTVVGTDEITLNGAGGIKVSTDAENNITITGGDLAEHIALNGGVSDSPVAFINVPVEGRKYNVHINLTRTITVPVYDADGNMTGEEKTLNINKNIYDTVSFTYKEMQDATSSNPLILSWPVRDAEEGYDFTFKLYFSSFAQGVAAVYTDADPSNGVTSVSMISPATSVVKDYSLEKNGSTISLKCSDGTVYEINDDVASPGEVSITVGKDTSGKEVEGSIILNTGVVNSDAKYSIVGGTSDSSIVEDMVGSFGASVAVNPPEAKGAMSLSFGASTVAETAGSVAMGYDVVSGMKGFYWDHYADNDGSYKGFKISADGKTASICLAKLQKRDDTLALTSNLWNNANKDFFLTDSDYTNTSAMPWKVGDTITIYNRDLPYASCGTIANIYLSSQSRTKKAIIGSSTYTYTGNVWCMDVTALEDTVFPFTTPTAMTTTDSIVMLPHHYSVLAFYKEELKISGVGTGKYKPVPRTGLTDIAYSTFGVGAMNVSGGSLSQVFGTRNIITANASLVTGNDNEASCLSLIAGSNNIGAGRQSFIAGNGNKIINPANDSGIVGQGNLVKSSQSFVAGLDNVLEIYSGESSIFGNGNRVERDCLNSFVAGGTGNIVGGAYTFTNGNGEEVTNTYKGNNNLIGGNKNRIMTNDSFAVGENNITLSANSTVGGVNNIIYTTAGETALFGSNNKVGDGVTGSYANVVAGNSNTIIGAYNAFAGNGNKAAYSVQSSTISGTSNNIGDANLKKTIKNSVISGSNNKIQTLESGVVVGTNNTVNATTGESAVFGQGNTVLSGGQSLVAGHTNTSDHGEVLIAGKFNKVSHHAATVLGIQNISSRSYQTVLGKGAAENAKAMFIIGNGDVTADAMLADDYDPKNSKRKNIFEVLEDGTVNFKKLVVDTVTANSIANEKYSIISGKGNSNAATESAIFGDSNNITNGDHLIVAGNNNTIKRATDVAIFGQGITFNDGDQCIASGLSHTLYGSESAIVGGKTNAIGREDSTVANGRTLNSGIFVGINNKIGTDSAVKAISNSAIVGGDSNAVQANYSVVVGGYNNAINSNSVKSVILGGEKNKLNSTSTSIILGGNNNTLTSCNDSLIAGEANKNVAKASGNYGNQIAIFGYSNEASCSDSFTCGRWSKANDSALFTVGAGSSSKRDNALTILENGKAYLGDGTVAGEEIATKAYVDANGGSGGGVSIDNFDSRFFKQSGSTITLDLSVLLTQEW